MCVCKRNQSKFACVCSCCVFVWVLVPILQWNWPLPNVSIPLPLRSLTGYSLHHQSPAALTNSLKHMPYWPYICLSILLCFCGFILQSFSVFIHSFVVSIDWLSEIVCCSGSFRSSILFIVLLLCLSFCSLVVLAIVQSQPDFTK